MLHRLLIVDDNPEMRRLIRTVVEDLVEHIDECGDGADAVLKYGSMKPDIVLMDIEMPRLDGLSAARRISVDFPGADIIMITKYDSPRMRREASLSGARDFVLKENLLDIRQLLCP